MSLQTIAQVAQIISTSAICLSAVTAVIVLIYTRRTNRRRATLDMVMRTFLDEKGMHLYNDFMALVRRDADPNDPFRFADLYAYRKEIEVERDTVIDQLNSYELVALGIRRGVFDEEFYKHWFHGQFVRDFKSVAGLIAIIQEERPSTFCEYKALFDRWERKRHPHNHPSRLKKIWWAATGKDAKLQSVLGKD